MMNWFNKIYYNEYFPRCFYKKYDGGKESGVTGYFLLEWKFLFSIGILHFTKSHRENYHSHSFNAITWWLKGHVTEEICTFNNNNQMSGSLGLSYKPSIKPKITKKDKIHKIIVHKDAWALTFRGPWSKMWFEVTPEGRKIHMIHGRKIVGVS